MAVPATVLLVEDEPLLIMLFEDILEGTEFDLVAALQCNRDALDWLHDHTPDLAVVDYTLSDGPCLPVIDALKQAQVPFLVSTGHISGEISELEGVPFLSKPFQEEHLVTMLRDIAATIE